MSRIEVNKKAKDAGWYMERGIARNVTYAPEHWNKNKKGDCE